MRRFKSQSVFRHTEHYSKFVLLRLQAITTLCHGSAHPRSVLPLCCSTTANTGRHTQEQQQPSPSSRWEGATPSLQGRAGLQAALSKLSEAEHQTRFLLEEQKNQILSKARSEMNMHELRAESADTALCESNLQINSQRMSSESVTRPFQDRKSGFIRNWRSEKELFKKLV